jgi:hypothetical protein
MAALALLASDVRAVWITANNTTYTAGEAENPSPSYPGSDGLNGQYTPLPADAQGRRGVAFNVKGCCLANNFCDTNWQEGVFVYVDITITTNAGPVIVSASDSKCPAECLELAITVLESPAGSWGQPKGATGVSIDVFVQCICCLGGITTGEDDYEYPRADLTPHS